MIRIMAKTISFTTNVGCRIQCKFCPQDDIMISYAKKESISKISFSEIENIGLLTKSLKSKLLIQTIEETWNSKEMKYFREIHKNGEFWKHPVCKKCVLSTSHFDVQNSL